MTTPLITRIASVFAAVPILSAQPLLDKVPLRHWPAPLYWQPGLAALGPLATAPSDPNPLTFIAMTPCRVVDTRTGFGFSGAFGPPSLVGGVSRAFPMQASTTCSIPATAQAYSLNITVVPPGPLSYITVWPTGQSQPVVSTLNDPTGTIVANAAIVPAGTAGSINVFATQTTDLVVDINGYYAAPTDLNGNTAIGAGTLANNLTGNNNTATGGGALQSNTTGSLNTASGTFALQFNTIGSNNMASGALALQDNTTGSLNTASGASALQNNTTGSNNTASGTFALQFNTTGGGNTANGALALNSNTPGSQNTATGQGALAANLTGGGNTATGQGALSSNTTGGSNTAIGLQALFNNTMGSGNTATGVSALFTNTTGFDNTAIAQDALFQNTTGTNNTAIGFGALGSNTTGSNNTAIGLNALGGNVKGNNNIAIGFEAASGLSGISNNNIHIGSPGSVGDDGTIRIGTSGTQTSFYVAGVNGVTTTNSAVPVLIDTTNGQLGITSSSRRYKEEIQDMGDLSNGLMSLRPVTFRYQKPFADGSKPTQYGLIAEEVAEVYPDLVAHSADGQIETVKYQVLDSMLLNEVQRLNKENQALQERLSRLEAAMASVASGAGGSVGQQSLVQPHTP
jgi:hypothetical protein